MQYLYHAAYLNEKGFGLMESGKQHEAFETFIGAVESISTMAQVMESHRQHQHRALSLLPSSRRRKQQPVSAFSSCILYNDNYDLDGCGSNHSTSSTGSSSHSLCQHSNNFVYNQAFRFTAPRDLSIFFDNSREEGGGQSSPSAAHYIKLYRAILTFNSALTFHQRSIGANESVKKTAEQVACDLYMDAINLLQDCYSTMDSCRVMAAALNNAAILFYELRDFAKFECFQSELHLLLVDMESSFPRCVDPQCLKSLFFNATLLSPPRTAGAA
ncbi:expressed unknown protein [Seminavis robusta]|uniref:Uncharacterized protein n=1 Tax=Seminavis robusta TaxID=568900 RepID=A0A9N8EWL5_9STRA|nr:expressed unknown protein [Seminavis robusta]|eukprot:Sro1976_g308890.1 n/a (272) ;mRNA; r:12674-13489